jgi:hypothetical protein
MGVGLLESALWVWSRCVMAVCADIIWSRPSSRMYDQSVRICQRMHVPRRNPPLVIFSDEAQLPRDETDHTRNGRLWSADDCVRTVKSSFQRRLSETVWCGMIWALIFGLFILLIITCWIMKFRFNWSTFLWRQGFGFFLPFYWLFDWALWKLMDLSGLALRFLDLVSFDLFYAVLWKWRKWRSVIPK